MHGLNCWGRGTPGSRWPIASLSRKEEPVVSTVTIKGSKILPRSVVEKALQDSDVLGKPFDPETSGTFVSLLNSWYIENGYLLSKCHEVAPVSREGRLVLHVVEPKIGKSPVALSYFRAPKGLKGNSSNSSKPVVYEPTMKGRTNTRAVAKALGLKPGSLFKWKASEVDRLRSSGLFHDVALRNVSSDADGDVIVELDVTEKPSYVSFEPGLKANINDRVICGEMLLKHSNLWGLNHKLSGRFLVNPAGSCLEGSVDYSDDQFGRAGAYSIEGFQTSVLMKRRQRGSEALLRRGGKGRYTLTPRGKYTAIVGVKEEVIQSCYSDSKRPKEHIESCTSENSLHYNFKRLTNELGANVIAGVRKPRPSQARPFITSELYHLSELPLDAMTGVQSLHLNWQVVQQSSRTPHHERSRLRVRGAEQSPIGSGAGWVCSNAEMHNKLTDSITSTMFLDGAVSGVSSPVSSCGVGLLFGPIKFELAYHRAKAHFLVGFRGRY